MNTDTAELTACWDPHRHHLPATWLEIRNLDRVRKLWFGEKETLIFFKIFEASSRKTIHDEMSEHDRLLQIKI